MGERMFPGDRRHGRDLLDATVLHRLLTLDPPRVTPERLVAGLLGRTPSLHEVRTMRRALARLARDGLVDLTATTAGASRAAQRFHELMLGGPNPGGTETTRRTNAPDAQ